MNLAYLWCLEKFSEDNKFLDITLSHCQFPQISIKFPRLNPSLTATTNCHSNFSLQLSEDFVTGNILISPNHFGFRLKSSTVSAASQLSEQILYSLDIGCLLTSAVSLDLAQSV